MTERIYYTNAYAQQFSAKITRMLDFEGRPAVVLDQTCFYPTSGGQPNDLGILNDIQVLDVIDSGAEIIHVLAQPVGESGSAYGTIDWARRFDHMQQHTGQHILSQAFLKVDPNAETLSFHLGAQSCTIDLDIEQLDREVLYAVEDLANQAVFENRPVKVHFIDSASQEELPIRKESDREGIIRVVEIGGFDYSPCGGTHCRNTGEVGQIKIRRWERFKQRVRVEFFCGRRALLDYRFKNRQMYLLSNEFSTGEEEVLNLVRKQAEQLRAQRKQIENLSERLLESEVTRLLDRSEPRSGYELITAIVEDVDPKQFNKLASLILATGDTPRILLLGLKGEKPSLLFARTKEPASVDLRELLKEAAPHIDGKGGGSPDRVQAGGSRGDGLAEALEAALARLDETQRAVP